MIRRLAILLALPIGALAADEPTVSFENDVLPVLTRAGCMAGACHAKNEGQNGFQLSIFSHDPDSDYREIVYDARGRRIFPSAPDHSLLLLKATNQVPHEGEERFAKDSDAYRVVRKWIAEGAPRSVPDEPEPTGIAIEPGVLTLQKEESRPLRVTVSFSDGSTRDVTHLCEYT
ncbi:MAG: S-layer protein, partial [Gemmatimonadota bacterium]|nr:S-layer protein [Gemmatimonadota bacterium]